MRLDNELVTRGIFETRNKAQSAIKEKNIMVNGVIISKPSFEVGDKDFIEVTGKTLPYVSRGGLKLEKALKVFEITLLDKIMLDIGSSTGGFTDCALQNKIKKVIAVDVGSDQMAKSIRENVKVMLYENTDFRMLDNEKIYDANIATIDVSFISVTKIIDKFENLDNLNEVICLIKPQFECGKEIADKYKGIINDKNVHLKVINNVCEFFKNINYKLESLTSSPIKGGSGNIEYLGYFKREVHLNEKEYDISNVEFQNNIKNVIKDAFTN